MAGDCAPQAEEQRSRIPKEYFLPKFVRIDDKNVVNVPRTCDLLNEGELAITENYDATALAEAIAQRQLTSEAVTRAFCKRAAVAHQVTNCLTEIFFDTAIQRAKELDQHLQQHGTTIGPLHGVPVSIKDGFKMKGIDASIGYAALAFSPSTTNSPLVQILLKAGAVLYCKTNIPQTLSALDSHNNVFGRLFNPANRALTAGGSSGGEGALIAMRGSVLGVGTDVGGSIRIPAFCNHIFGVKPSAGRVPYNGQEGGKPAGENKVALQASAGPLATSTRDCELFLRVVAEQEPWTYAADVVYGAWSSQGPRTKPEQFTIGVVRRDGVIEPLPPVSNVLDETAAALKRDGIKVVEMDITPVFSKCQSLANQLMGIEGDNFGFDIMESTGEPLSPWLQGRMKRKERLTLVKTRELHARRAALYEQFLKCWQTETGGRIDAFICPLAAHPVPPIDTWNGVSYTSSFVLLDCPAGYVPVRKLVQRDLNGEVPASAPLGSWDKRNREFWTKFDKSLYIGSSLGVQVVVPRLQERTLVHAMGIVDEAVRRHMASGARDSRL